MVLLLALSVGCNKNDDTEEPLPPPVKTFDVKVQLVYPQGYSSNSGINVKLTNSITNTTFEAATDSTGMATFTVTAGVYDASASETRSIAGNAYLLNGIKSGITINDSWTGSEAVSINLEESKAGQLVVKEFYFNGCQQNVSGKFQRDPYVILYNNSNATASLENLCFGVTLPSNSHGSNNDYVDGTLSYASEGWIPAGFGIFYFSSTLTLAPGEQAVVAINGALDHTITYSNSVNLAKPDYFVFYDPDKFSQTTYHPSPSEAIPTSHYLKAVKLAGVTSTAFTMSVTGPAFFIFATENVTPAEFATNPANLNQNNGSATQTRAKVPSSWVIDGVEVFKKDGADNKKRLTANIDAGSIAFPDVSQGYTIYRNVNKTATEAIASNAGKLVYSYSGGVDDTTDPSGIDAEASIRNGAHIIYMDTNNSSSDFHVRGKASLKN